MKSILLLAACVLFGMNVLAQTPIKILSGGPATVKVLNSKRAELEKAAGAPVDFAVTPIESAMISFSKGLVDGIIVGTQPDKFISEFKAAPIGSPADYQWTEIAEGLVKLALNPKNSADKLSSQQISDILSGKILSWKAINGQDQPVVVYTPTSYQLTIKSVMQKYLGADKSPVAKPVTDKDGALRALEQTPGGIAILVGKDKSPTIEPKYIDTEATFPIFLKIKKSARPETQKLTEYFKTQPKIRL